MDLRRISPKRREFRCDTYSYTREVSAGPDDGFSTRPRLRVVQLAAVFSAWKCRTETGGSVGPGNPNSAVPWLRRSALEAVDSSPTGLKMRRSESESSRGYRQSGLRERPRGHAERAKCGPHQSRVAQAVTLRPTSFPALRRCNRGSCPMLSRCHAMRTLDEIWMIDLLRCR